MESNLPAALLNYGLLKFSKVGKANLKIENLT